MFLLRHLFVLSRSCQKYQQKTSLGALCNPMTLVTRSSEVQFLLLLIWKLPPHMLTFFGKHDQLEVSGTSGPQLLAGVPSELSARIFVSVTDVEN